jgi:hypothetical protein
MGQWGYGEGDDRVSALRDMFDGGGRGGSGNSYSTLDNADYQRIGGGAAVAGERPQGYTSIDSAGNRQRRGGLLSFGYGYEEPSGKYVPASVDMFNGGGAGMAGNRLLSGIIFRQLARGLRPAATGCVRMSINLFQRLLVIISFDKFDTSKIGTGEGAQAYGHGLYFAENEGVARGYRDALSGNLKATIGKKPIMDVYSGLEKQAERMPIKSAQDTYDKMDFLYNLENTSDFNVAFSRIENPSVAKWAEKEIKPKFNPAGNMYEVKINADPKDFLNWDLPISQQPKAFQDIVRNSDLTHLPEHGRLRRTIEAWRKNKGDWVPESGANIPEPSGNDIYNALTDFGTDPTRNVNFSNELNNSGVKGIKYLDEGSRGKGYEVKLGIKGKPYETEPQYARSKEEADQISKEYQNRGFETKIEESGTRNYVVFDDKLVSIVRKYGIAGAATMLGVSQADVAEAMDQGNKPQGLLSK